MNDPTPLSPLSPARQKMLADDAILRDAMRAGLNQPRTSRWVLPCLPETALKNGLDPAYAFQRAHRVARQLNGAGPLESGQEALAAFLAYADLQRAKPGLFTERERQALFSLEERLQAEGVRWAKDALAVACDVSAFDEYKSRLCDAHDDGEVEAEDAYDAALVLWRGYDEAELLAGLFGGLADETPFPSWDGYAPLVFQLNDFKKKSLVQMRAWMRDSAQGGCLVGMWGSPWLQQLGLALDPALETRWPTLVQSAVTLERLLVLEAKRQARGLLGIALPVAALEIRQGLRLSGPDWKPEEDVQKRPQIAGSIYLLPPSEQEKTKKMKAESVPALRFAASDTVTLPTMHIEFTAGPGTLGTLKVIGQWSLDAQDRKCLEGELRVRVSGANVQLTEADGSAIEKTSKGDYFMVLLPMDGALMTRGEGLILTVNGEQWLMKKPRFQNLEK